jgi:arylsulfatase A-like enzyme
MLPLLPGCGDDTPRFGPTQRIVDLVNPSVSVAGLPVATLRDETRPVLRGHAHASLLPLSRVTASQNARVSLHPELPAELAGAERLLLAPKLRFRGSWSVLPPVLMAAGPPAPGGRVAVELGLPREVAGATILLGAKAWAVPDSLHRVIETPPLDLRAGSKLEFGMGMDGPLREQGPVSFAVQACRKGDCEEVFRETLDPATRSGWHDRAVDLAERSPGRVVLRFETRAEASGPRAFALPVWSSPTVYAPVPDSDGAFNILLFSLDTLRADRLPSYGYPLATAPFLAEKFGRDGTVADAFVAAASSTGPAHMSLFTSLHASVHGVRLGVGQLAPDVATLAQLLRGAGFETGAVTENAALAVYRGFGRGFESYLENKSAGESWAAGLVEETFAAAREWLAQRRDRRFFLFVHTYQVHHPYTPPERYAALFDEPAPGFEPAPELTPDRDPALYDREIRYLDDQLRVFFDWLEAMDLTDDTLVIVTSDHGEEFLEHGEIGHGPHLNSEVTHVPLMLAGPGIPRGRRLREPLGHVDLMPTLLELAGVAVPPGAMGRSFAHRLRDDAGDDGEQPRPLFAEAWWVRSARRLGPPLAIRTGHRKLIRTPTPSGAVYEYYDLAADPHERHDLFGAEGVATDDLEQQLDAYAATVAAREEEHRRVRAARRRGATEPEIDPDREDKLRALGYVE